MPNNRRYSRTARYEPDARRDPIPNNSRKPKPAMPDVSDEALIAQGLVKVTGEDGVTHWTKPTAQWDKSVKGNWATVTHKSKQENE